MGILTDRVDAAETDIRSVASEVSALKKVVARRAKREAGTSVVKTVFSLIPIVGGMIGGAMGGTMDLLGSLVDFSDLSELGSILLNQGGVRITPEEVAVRLSRGAALTLNPAVVDALKRAGCDSEEFLQAFQGAGRLLSSAVDDVEEHLKDELEEQAERLKEKAKQKLKKALAGSDDEDEPEKPAAPRSARATEKVAERRAPEQPLAILTRRDRNAFIEAAKRGELQEIKRLYTRFPTIIDTTSVGEVQANGLYYAAMQGHEEVAVYLLEKGLDPHASASDGKSALDMARVHDHKALGDRLAVDWAWRQGDPWAWQACKEPQSGVGKKEERKAAEESCPLHEAIRDDAPVDAIEELLSITDINAPDLAGKSPVQLAVELGKLEIVKCLLKNGAKVEGVAQWRLLKQAKENAERLSASGASSAADKTDRPTPTLAFVAASPAGMWGQHGGGGGGGGATLQPPPAPERPRSAGHRP